MRRSLLRSLLFAAPLLVWAAVGWQRSGNTVIETGESVDTGNPHVSGQLCN